MCFLAVGVGHRELGKWKLLGWWGALSLRKRVVGWADWEAGISNEVEAIRAVKGSEPQEGGALEWGAGRCLSDIFKNYIALPKDAAWLCFETGPRLSYRLRWTCLGLARSSPDIHPSLSVLSSISSGLSTAHSRVLGTGAQPRGSPSSDLLPCLHMVCTEGAWSLGS